MIPYSQSLNVSTIGSDGLELDSSTFGLIPKATTVVFDCLGSPTQYDLALTDTGGGIWTTSGNIEAGCGYSSVGVVTFRRADMPGASVRAVAASSSYAADEAGGASYKLDGTNSMLYVQYWGADTSLNPDLVVDGSGGRFATTTFAFDGGNSCPTQTGSYVLSTTADEFTINLPQTVIPLPTPSGSGTATFLSQSYDGSSTQSYTFSMAGLTVGTAYTAIVSASWGGGPSTCSGTFTFTIDHLNFEAAAAPPNPSGLTHSAVSTTEIHLGWSSGGGTTVRYKVVYLAGATPPTTCKGTGETTSGTGINIQGLTHLTQYSFRVCAENINGPPDVSSGITATETTL